MNKYLITVKNKNRNEGHNFIVPDILGSNVGNVKNVTNCFPQTITSTSPIMKSNAPSIVTDNAG